MSHSRNNSQKLLQWRLECLGHSLLEGLTRLLPGAWLFRLGEALGGLVWHFMPLRREMILRNLRIAFAGEKNLAELRLMAKATFRRTGGNLISAAHTARLTPAQLGKVIHIENLALLEAALADGHGVVLLLAHMGNWEVLSRLVHLFPKGSRAGAFYRPLNNTLLDEQVLKRRQADGTRMFSKRDNPLHVASFLRQGGIVGILADQRVGVHGEAVSFFGRLTRVSPLPSLLARRSKSVVLALAVTTVKPGQWQAVFMPVESPPTTANCMVALERAMRAGPLDVFWFQERWKLYVRPPETIQDWLGSATARGDKPHRVLIWLAGAASDWQLPEAWTHPDVVYEVALPAGRALPGWLPASTRVHPVGAGSDRATLLQSIRSIDESAALPLDFILTTGPSEALTDAARRVAVPVLSLP
ncbi:MAG: lysophospholipid acyltransferase family protein [Verrucomicrobiota bacterium]